MARAIVLLLMLCPMLQAGSSNSLMDVTPNGERLLVANTDSGTVSIVDLKTRQQTLERSVGDHPEGVAWANGYGLVTVYGDDQLVALDPATGEKVFTLTVPDEPYGIVTTRDGRTAFLTHDDPGAVSVVDLVGRKLVRTARVGENVRGIALSADERTLYVTEFFTGTLLAVSAATLEVTDRWTGHSQDNLARQVVLHPTRAKAYIPHIRSRITAFDARGSIFPHVSFCDLVPASGETQRRRSLAIDAYNFNLIVTNPWEVAIAPDGSKLYSLYAGTDDLNVSNVLNDDYQEVEPRGRVRPSGGKHPRAIRTSPSGHEVYILNTLSYAVTVFDAEVSKPLAVIPVGKPAKTAAWRRGKELFVSAKQPMGSARWIACSSCHPDGLSDGRVWQNPEGHRKTPHLFGLAHTHPLHWSGDRDETQDFEYTIRGKLMQGRGLTPTPIRPATGFTDFAALEETLRGRSPDLDALAVYTNSFPVKLSPHIVAPGQLTPQAEQGKALFFSSQTGCAECHSGPYFTDSRRQKPYRLHDVGTGTGADEKIGPRYDTPTLLGAYRKGPYLHDGRAKSLEDVFTTHNRGDLHGKTSQLSQPQIQALAAFVRSLPYETPPRRTENSVADYVD
jgi:YVTN family beta-propeller protein